VRTRITILAQDAEGTTLPVLSRGLLPDTRAPVLTLTSRPRSHARRQQQALGTADATGSTLTVLNYRLDDGVVRSLTIDNTTGRFDLQLNFSSLDVALTPHAHGARRGRESGDPHPPRDGRCAGTVHRQRRVTD